VWYTVRNRGVSRGLSQGGQNVAEGVHYSRFSEKKLRNDSESGCREFQYYLKNNENTPKNAKITTTY